MIALVLGRRREPKNEGPRCHFCGSWPFLYARMNDGLRVTWLCSCCAVYNVGAVPNLARFRTEELQPDESAERPFEGSFNLPPNCLYVHPNDAPSFFIEQIFAVEEERSVCCIATDHGVPAQILSGPRAVPISLPISKFRMRVRRVSTDSADSCPESSRSLRAVLFAGEFYERQ